MSEVHGFARYITSGNLIVARECRCGAKFSTDDDLNGHARAKTWIAEIDYRNEAVEGGTHMVEEIDNDPYDALRLAVDLHSERYQYQDVTSETVLQTADAFLAWLRSKKEER